MYVKVHLAFKTKHFQLTVLSCWDTCLKKEQVKYSVHLYPLLTYSYIFST